MRIHHLSCATLCPILGKLINSKGYLVCHCLLIETPNSGLVLVDTGFGQEELKNPRRHLGWISQLTKLKSTPEDSAFQQILKLGFSPNDVRHIVLTHLDLDHAGGIKDFPNAEIHVFGPEYVAALAPTTLLERHRYQAKNWSHSPKWSVHRVSGERWKGFESVRDLKGLPPEILMVPLTGHTLGHCGVAVQSDNGWLFHVGDAYFHHKEVDVDSPRCPKLLDRFQRTIQVDEETRLANQSRLRDLIKNNSDVSVFCAHDPSEFERFANPSESL